MQARPLLVVGQLAIPMSRFSCRNWTAKFAFLPSYREPEIKASQSFTDRTILQASTKMSFKNPFALLAGRSANLNFMLLQGRQLCRKMAKTGLHSQRTAAVTARASLSPSRPSLFRSTLHRARLAQRAAPSPMRPPAETYPARPPSAPRRRQRSSLQAMLLLDPRRSSRESAAVMTEVSFFGLHSRKGVGSGAI